MKDTVLDLLTKATQEKIVTVDEAIANYLTYHVEDEDKLLGALDAEGLTDEPNGNLLVQDIIKKYLPK